MKIKLKIKLKIVNTNLSKSVNIKKMKRTYEMSFQSFVLCSFLKKVKTSTALLQFE